MADCNHNGILLGISPSIPFRLTKFMPEMRPSSPPKLPALPSAMLRTLAAVLFVLAVFAIALFSEPEVSPAVERAITIICVTYALLFPLGIWLLYRRVAIAASNALQRTLSANEALETHVLELQQEAEARKAIEARLQLALDTQSRQLATQRDFSAMLSHELRTPLSVIDMASQSLQLMELGQDPDAARRIERIRSAVSRLDALASGLQSIERLDRELANRRFSRVSLTGVARKTAASLSYGHQLELDMQASPTVAGDAGLLDIALSNLVENALKYAGDGGPIVISVSSHGQEARVAVRDHGPGIAHGDLTHVFERFFRSGHTSHKPGAGQGLFLTKRICEAHGGTVSARNMPDGGCEFAMVFPISAASTPSW